MPSLKVALVPQLPDLEEIKPMRKRLDITQRELAAMAGVSQSLIAKIERGAIDPSYENVRKVFKAFDTLMRDRTVDMRRDGTRFTVGDLATRGVVSIAPDATLAEGVDKMVRGRFTQLPVMSGDRIVGGITDDQIRDHAIEETKNAGKSYEDVMKTRIDEVMSGPFPVLSEDTPIELASLHLQREEAVLVSRRGALIGILTSADFLNLGLR